MLSSEEVGEAEFAPAAFGALGDTTESTLGASLFAAFVRGMHNLPGETLDFESWVVLHRACFLVSIGCSNWGGTVSAFIELGEAMRILIWMQAFGATKGRAAGFFQER